MPFVSHELLSKVVRALPKRGLAAFVVQPGFLGQSSKFKVQSSKSVGLPGHGVVGFPFVLKRETLPVVEQLLSSGRYSLQDLATSLSAKLVRVPKPFQGELFNINTPADWERAREFWKENLLSC
jgi:molybdopterin-guanine dinucleotide biosynthesis protein A